MLYEIGELDRVGVTIGVSPSERRRLARVDDRLGVEWRSDGSARVYSTGNVGNVALSPSTVIVITTKVPIANVLRLASLAFHTLPIAPSAGHALLEFSDRVVDWLALLVVTEVEALQVRGLRQDYVLVEDELPYIRGRLRWGAATPWTRPGLTACEFVDFLPDIAENRVLRATLEVLQTRRLLPGLNTRVQRILRSFQGVGFTRPSTTLFDSIRITRLNRHYEPAICLCRLFLDQPGIALDAGSVRAPAYFFPMELVFQEAITNLLRTRLPFTFRQPGGSYQSVSGTPVRSLTFAADVVIGSPPQPVIDTRYAIPEVRNRFGGWSFHNDHVYQALFYVRSFGCPALLVYPKIDREVDTAFDIQGSPVSIFAVDLSEPGLPGLDALVNRIEIDIAVSSAA